MRGGEKCLEVFCELFPQADVFTLLHIPGNMSPTIERMSIHTSFVQSLPFAASKYRHYLPLFPRAIERFDFESYDLILSSSHCVAKGAIPGEKSVHVCYCFTPMRYVWDMYDSYFCAERTGLLRGWAIGRVARRLRRWDVESAERVHRFVAISEHVADRIRRHYDRDSDIIYPPVDCDQFRIVDEVGDYYLVVSAFAPYKRIDLAVEACNELGAALKIVGSGQDEAQLRELAGPTVEFLGWRSDEEIADLYSRCRAFLFPGEEDFGITPLEAMASGRPVIAYGRGGALETVSAPGGERPATGVFFHEQTVAGLRGAVEMLEARLEGFDPKDARARALEFDRPVFKQRVSQYLSEALGRPAG